MSGSSIFDISSSSNSASSLSKLEVSGYPMVIVVDDALAVASESAFIAWLGDSSCMLDRFDARHCFDDARMFNDIAASTSNGGVRVEPNFGLKRDAIEKLFELRYNDFVSLLELRARDVEQARLDAEAVVAAAAAAEEQERRDAEARKSKKATVPYEYAPQPKTSKDVEPLIAQGKDAVEEYEAERRATPNDILVPRDSLTREVFVITAVCFEIQANISIDYLENCKVHCVSGLES